MSTPKVAFMFSGQGSQYFQMGQELYERQPTFQRWMDRLDAQARELAGVSVVETLYRSGHTKAESFDRTLLTHPAIFMVEYALGRALLEAGIVPDIAIGASLGTFAAASLAGFLDVEDALTAVIRHAKAVEASCEQGTMIAVLANPKLYEDAGLNGYSDLAAVNFHSNFVVATTARHATTVVDTLRGRDVTFQKLPVSFAFHSRWIDAAETPFKNLSKSLRVRSGDFPVVCCARTTPLDTLPDGHFWTVTREPVLFQRTMERVEAGGPYRYVDLSPAGTLATMTKYVLQGSSSQSETHAILSPFGREFDRLTTVSQKLPVRAHAPVRPVERPSVVQPASTPAAAAPKPNGVTTPVKATAFVFPGQGSQKRGMGKDLFDSVQQYVALEREVDAILGYSLRNLCVEDPENRLKESQFTQPSLYIVNALFYYKALEEGGRPDYLAGHSLGEYNALLAAGAFDLLTGLRLVKRRGELMSQAKNGGMAAVIGMTEERIAQVLAENDLGSIDIANFNSSSQIVISGPADDIVRGKPIFEESGARVYMPLPVGAAFHSRYVADAGRAFADFLAPIRFEPLKLPVIANVTAQPYGLNASSETIKSLLVQQITKPVQWMQSMHFMMAAGVETFKEMGPGNVLTRLTQHIQKERAGK